MVISGFNGAWGFLSNFYAVEIYLERAAYPSVEHAYQAAKTLDEGMRARIARATTPGEAKRLGRGLEGHRLGWLAREGGEPLRVEYMRYLLWYKFAMHDRLAAQLLATGGEDLVEVNTWGDTFWGVWNGRGSNMLGQLLMELRDQLRRTGIPPVAASPRRIR